MIKPVSITLRLSIPLILARCPSMLSRRQRCCAFLLPTARAISAQDPSGLKALGMMPFDDDALVSEGVDRIVIRECSLPNNSMWS
jgi:hypothetical protein